MRRYSSQDRDSGSGAQDFSHFLQKEVERKQSRQPKQEEKLRLMGGLSQYNRQAVEFVFLLSSETDYRA